MASDPSYVGTRASQRGFSKYSNLAWCSDEADVFLERRGGGIGSNTEKNALVSGKEIQSILDLVLH